MGVKQGRKSPRKITTLELRRILRETRAGTDYRTIASNLSRNPSVVLEVIRRYGGNPVLRSRCGRPAWKDYTVYDSKSEEVLAYGTAKECARKLGIKQATFYQYMSRQRRGGITQPVIIAEEVPE